ncbi:MAG: hypothetical protein ACLVBW_01965 [Lachnospiraceae bacterium]|jgi:hypothetical protein
MSPERFWGYSIAEVQDILKSCARIRQRQQKERLNAASYIVTELGTRIGIMLGNKEAQVGHIWDYFPSLYQEEKEMADQMQKEAEIERVRESRYRYAAIHNSRWKEVEDDGDTDTTDTASSDTSGPAAVH